MPLAIHMQKMKKTDLKGMENHLARKGKCSTNPDINPKGDKMCWPDTGPKGMYQRIKARIDSLNLKRLRKDAVFVNSFVVTAGNEEMENLTKDQQIRFFTEAFSWFTKRYGAENIAYAVIHFDEKTPHLHIGIIPITQDKLSSREVFNRNELRLIQDELAKEIGVRYGFERGKEGSTAKHIDTARFKEMEAKKSLLAAENKLSAIQEEVTRLQKFLEALKEQIAQNEIMANQRTTAVLGQLKAVLKQVQPSTAKQFVMSVAHELGLEVSEPKREVLRNTQKNFSR